MKRQSPWRMVLLVAALIAAAALLSQTTLAGFTGPDPAAPGAATRAAAPGAEAGSPARGALEQGAGTITGTVTAAATSVAVERAQVEIFTSAGQFHKVVETNALGQYSTPALAEGLYYVRAMPPAGSELLAQLYQNLPCTPSCSIESGTPVPVTAGGATANIDFALEAGGLITGTVTHATTGAVLANAWLQFRSMDNTWMGWAITNTQGQYVSPGLPAGSYYVVVDAPDSGLVDQLYAGLPCPDFYCDMRQGTPVAVTVPGATPNIDFALQPGGTISGQVTDGTTNTALPGSMLEIYSATGMPMSLVVADAQGRYTSAALPAGSYFAVAQPPFPSVLLPQLFRDLPCYPHCDPTTGTPIAVAPPNATPNIDFVLLPGATISGTVTDAATGDGVANVTLYLHRSSGSLFTTASTNAQGQYAFEGLGTGSYFVRAEPPAPSGLLGQLYQNLPWPCSSPGCKVTDGTPIAATAPLVSSNIDFPLQRGGTIAGTVTAAATGAPVANVALSVYSSSTGTVVGAASTNAQGEYVSSGLETGTYFVVADPPASTGLMKQLYQNLGCYPNCAIGSGTPVAVTAPAATGNINFPLQAGGTIAGTVTNQATQAAVANVTIRFYSSTGLSLGSATTNAQGQYSSMVLPAGSYFVHADPPAASGLLDLLYDGVACPGGDCPITGGTPVAVVQGTTGGIDFALEAGGTITGKVTRAGTTTRVENVSISFFSSTGIPIGSAYTNLQGEYTSPGLPAGTYFVQATPSSSSGLLAQLYQNLTCGWSCIVTTGTRVAVTPPGVTPDIDFALEAGGRISGTITNAATSAPVPNVSVRVYSSTGSSISSATTNSQGQYATVALPSGSYYVVATASTASGLLSQLYANLPCHNGCTITSGTSVAVAAPGATEHIDFALQPGAWIGGVVTSAATDAPVAGAAVSFYSSTGSSLGSASTNAQGQYLSPTLQPGASYYVKVLPPGVSGLLGQLHDGVPCPNGTCSLADATPVMVTTPGATVPIDFALQPGGSITGTVTHAATGAPVANASVAVYSSTGSSLGWSTTNAQGQFVSPGLATGVYYLQAAPPDSSGLLGQRYRALPCSPDGSCTATDGTPVAVTAPGATSNIDFSLQPGGTIAGIVTDAASGTGVADVQVRFFTTRWYYAASTSTNALGQYVSPGLPAGSYFVVAEPYSEAGLIGQVYPGVPCPDGSCNLSDGTPVAVVPPAAIAHIDFALQRGGRLKGTVTDATTNAGMRNVLVYVFATDGNIVGFAVTDPYGRYLSSALPTGSYYLLALPNESGLLMPQVYRNLPCPLGQCDPLEGTAVTVTAPSVTSNIDFALQPGGTISGTVTHAVTRAPVANAKVYFTSSEWRSAGPVTTDGQGRYSSPGLPSGSYYVRVEPPASSATLGQLYQNLPCPNGRCSVGDGTAVAVTAPNAASGIDFALEPGATIAGTVSHGATTRGVDGVTMRFYSSAGSLVASVTTNIQGQYVSPGLPTGSYFVMAVPAASTGLVVQAYQAYACPAGACTVTDSAAVEATAPNQAPGIDFVLQPGGTMAGTVTDATTGAPLQWITVKFFTSSGAPAGQTSTSEGGRYTSPVLPRGSSFAATLATSQGYAGQLYQGITCMGCSVTDGTPVPIAASQVTGGIDFALGLAPAAPNDLQVNALPLVSTPYQSIVNTSGATTSADDPAVRCGSGGGWRSVWYTVTVGTTGTLRLDTAGSSYLTILSVYTGTPGSFTSVACNADSGNGLGAQVALNVTAGQQLSIMVSAAYSNGGVLALNAALPLLVDVTPGALQLAATKAGADGGLVSTTVPQTVTLTFSGPTTNAWTASSDQAWLQIVNGAGVASGQFTVAVANPDNVIGGATSLGGSITVTAAGAENAPVTIPVSLAVDQTGGAATAHPFGMVETPRQNSAGLVGSVAVTGWVLDDVGVESVRIYRNCLPFDSPFDCVLLDGERVVFVGDATLVAGARPDIEALFPDYPQSYRAAWGYLLLTNMLPHVTKQQMFGGQGSIILFARARDVEGKEVWLGRTRDDRTPTSIEMANDTIAVPFGAIDTPAQGETVSGTIANFGWALTPDGDAAAGSGDIVVPTDGSTLRVYIDGVPGPAISYNQCRGSFVGAVLPGSYCDDDVASIFGNVTPRVTFTPRQGNPTKYRNLDGGRGAIGAYLLDTTRLSNGLHTIMWGVTDSAGRGEGLGSRYFTVLNGNVGATSSAMASAPAADPAGAHGSSARDIVLGGEDVRLRRDAAPGARPLASAASGQVPGGQPGAASVVPGQAGNAAGAAAASAPGADAVRSDAMPAQDQAAKAARAVSEPGAPGQVRPSAGKTGTALRTADAMSALETSPAQVRGDARALAALAVSTETVQARTGFSDRAPFAELAADQAGVRHVRLPQLGRLELRLGRVEAGYLVANGQLRDLPVGSHLHPATGQFTWAPGPGYFGTYELVFVRGGEQLRIVVHVGR